MAEAIPWFVVVCSEALKTFWALGVGVCGSELCVDFVLLAHRIDTGMPVLWGSFALSLVYRGVDECLLEQLECALLSTLL